MKIPLRKMHGMGNDYVVIEVAPGSMSLDSLRRLARRLCDRRGLIGADGVAFLSAAASSSYSATVFNPDGGVSGFCINGLRCAGRFLLDRGLGRTVDLVSAGRPVSVHRLSSGTEDEPPMFSLTAPSLRSALQQGFESGGGFREWQERTEQQHPELRFHSVDAGVPHAIALAPKIQRAQLNQIGLGANSALDLFPSGINVSIACLAGPNKVAIATYERGGAGSTLSCASAMAAATFSLARRGHLEHDKDTRIYSDGGVATCVSHQPDAEGTADVTVTAPCTPVFEAEIPYEPGNETLPSMLSMDYFSHEVATYDRFLNANNVSSTMSKYVI